MEIMSRVFRFKNMFMVGINVLIFPWIILSLHNIKHGWRRWYRFWRQSIVRFGGWILMKKWTKAFRKGDFLAKIELAEKHLEEH
jgi:hypothetical protein